MIAELVLYTTFISLLDVDNTHPTDCQVCKKYDNHHERCNLAREAYSKDKDQDWGSEYNVYTVNMQKVLIIPKMPIKNSFFVSRVVVFNETFAPLHQGDNKCLLWHEAIRVQNVTDVASTF